MNKIKAFWVFGLALLFLDRLTKWFFLKTPDFYSGRFIELKLFRNTKLYFISLNPIFLNFLIGAVLLLLVFLLLKTRNPGFFLIILAGLSNLFDRLYFGYVVDWLRIFILPISIFNLADIMIIGGILILAISYFDSKKFCKWCKRHRA